MRLTSNLIVSLAFLLAAIVATLVSVVAVGQIEARSERGISIALETEGLEWPEVNSDGLQVHISGTAPTEASRFRALTVAGGIVDAHRLVDKMDVADAADIEAPRFSVEILRNDDGISLIGLIPEETDREQVIASITDLADGANVTDMLETADYPTPDGWNVSLAYAMEALAALPRSKISMDAQRILITAISDSVSERTRLETRLLKNAPESIELLLDISAPRPVITPFTLRFIIENGTARFDACSAETEEARARIISAAKSAGIEGEPDCTIGLGNPSPAWAQAVETGIAAIAKLGGGSITFADADVTLIAAPETQQDVFDEVIGELATDLPDLFSLHSALPAAVTIDGTGEGSGPPEFIATLSPEGAVQLRGRLTDDRLRNAVESYAHAQFGRNQVYAATRIDSELPDGWPNRVLAGIEALAELSSGSLVVQPTFVDIRGTTGNANASAEISRILSEKLGAAENFGVEVIYQEALDPTAALPTPEECATNINAVLSSKKIVFPPGSATIDPGENDTLTAIADLLRDCQDVKMEIAGHTDSQGREEMNEILSQSRAEAVLQALMARRVLTSNLSAKGYGETKPIADNETDEGRDANRRIEFTLVTDEMESESTPVTETDTAEETDQSAETGTGTGTGTEDEQN